MSQYVFTDAQHTKELERLRAIEQVFDPASRRRLEATGINTNWHCLEVGAGAGSIARWMSDRVGDGGKVVAVDLDTRFVAPSKSPNLEVLQADLRDLALPRSFDLVHARYVLIHNADFQAVLSKMLDLLKPGGWIVIEEPDFSAARAIVGEEKACESLHRVNRAITQLFASRGMDYALGVKLPALFQSLGLCPTVENESHLCNGGCGVATVMRLSTVQLGESYLATGEVTPEDLEHYYQFAENQTAWAIYYATVGITAQKQLERAVPEPLQ